MSVAKSLEIPSILSRIDRKGFIVGPWFDGVFFIFSPFWALLIGLVTVYTPLVRERMMFGYETSPLNYALGVFIFAHLVIVFFRSHLNPKIFPLYPVRFVVVPILLVIGFATSTWLLVIGSVLATFWDVYHSGMQTFGLGRIYDMKAGNDPLAGRKLDWILNVLLYAGPIAAGATLMDHINDINEFEDVGAVFFTKIPAAVESHAGWLSLAVIAFGVPFVLYYLWANWRMARNGYTVSIQKVTLIAVTAVTSILVWGFNPFGTAFFVMNVFHAVQYFAIVWIKEQGNIARMLGCGSAPWGKWVALFALIGGGIAFGVCMETYIGENSVLIGLFLVVSLMHFWYDGFIWSVRARQV